MASHMSLAATLGSALLVSVQSSMWAPAARSVALISRRWCASITDNTEHRCFHKGRSCLTVTVNYFCDFVCDFIFLFIFRLRTVAAELLLYCATTLYCRFLINSQLRRVHHSVCVFSYCNFMSGILCLAISFLAFFYPANSCNFVSCYVDG